MLSRLQDEELWVSVHVACELMAGVELSSHPKGERAKVEALLNSVQVAFPDERFAPVYGRLLAWLSSRGETVASMDLLIATAAVVDSASIVTRNAKHLARIPELRVISY